MPDHDERIHVVRDASDVSPKVSVPATVTLVVAVVWSIIEGNVDPEQVSLAVAAVVQFVLGYLKSDELSPS